MDRSTSGNSYCADPKVTVILDPDSTPHASHANVDAHQAGSFRFKPALTIDEQVDHLLEQGIEVADRSFAKQCLLNTNYYRLRAYWMTFEQGGSIQKGTKFEDVWEIHEFDRELRLWLWRMIERIEIKARTQFAYVLSNGFGAEAHLSTDLFHDAKRHKESLKAVDKEVTRAKGQRMPCVVHNLSKYGKLPLWAAVEVMSMGTVSSLYGNLKVDLHVEGHGETVPEEIASSFGVSAVYLKSWLRHLTMVRNIGAHHNRFYNRLLKVKPRMLKKDKPYAGDREFPTFVVIKRVYEKLWPSLWKNEAKELDRLIRRYPNVSLVPLGFLDDWRIVLGLPEKVEG